MTSTPIDSASSTPDPAVLESGGSASLEQPVPAMPPAQDTAPHWSLTQWLLTGLRATACLRVNMGQATPSPAQLLWLIAIPAFLQVALARLEIPGEATFLFSAWFYPLCGLGLLVFMVWAAFRYAQLPATANPAPVVAWLGLWCVATLPIELTNIALTSLAARELLPIWWADGSWLAWLLYGLLWLWLLVVAARITAGLTTSRTLQIAVLCCVFLFQAFSSWQLDSRPWQTDSVAQDGDQEEALVLSQEVFEDQQTLLDNALASVTPRQPHRINVFGLVYAPYAQSVFVRESALVTQVLQQRFDATGHVVQMVNHPSVVSRLPWATNQNLQASIQAVADKMDRDQDVLVVYLSSHGGSDFKLASANPPLEVAELTPQMLRSMLDEAGVRNRVIAVSACYSGGWVAPLTGDSSLVMTAADATHTSYGCGSRSELTFFGRAMFDEQLRKTYSFEDAFTAAVPIIAQREVEGNKTDGFSNPQIAVGKNIRAVLAQLQTQLKAAHPL